MDKQITSLLNFIDNSPCNFYAVNTAKKMLEENGFTEKLLGNEIEAKPGEKFYFTKNDSAIFAFTVGKKPIAETGLKIVAAHSDSPCFRVKPHAEMLCEGGIVKLNTEVYADRFSTLGSTVHSRWQAVYSSKAKTLCTPSPDW